MSLIYAVLICIFATAITTIIKSFVNVGAKEVVVVDQFKGKYSKTLKKGIRFIIPFYEKPRKIILPYKTITDDSEEWTACIPFTKITRNKLEYTLPRMTIKTQDNIEAEINAKVTFEVTNAEYASRKTRNVSAGIARRTKTIISYTYKSCPYDYILRSRHFINKEVLYDLKKRIDGTGINICDLKITVSK